MALARLVFLTKMTKIHKEHLLLCCAQITSDLGLITYLHICITNVINVIKAKSVGYLPVTVRVIPCMPFMIVLLLY